MSEMLPLAVAVLALLAMVAVLVREGAFLDPQTRTIRRLRTRLGGRHTVTDAVLERTGLLSFLQGLADIRRLQAVAGRGSDPRVFLERTVRIAVVATMIPVAADAVSAVSGGDLAIAPILIPLFTIGGVLLAFADLHQTAARRRTQASRSLVKMLLLWGMTNATPVHSGERIEASDSLLVLAGALRTPALRDMIEGEAWHQLVSDHPRSRAELLETMGGVYGVPLFTELGHAVRTVQEYGGTNPAAEYSTLARATVAQWLADARVRLRSRTVTVLIPATGMLLAIFVVLFSAVAYTSGHGGLP